MMTQFLTKLGPIQAFCFGISAGMLLVVVVIGVILVISIKLT